MNKKDTWFIYLIRTHSGALYTGITTDVNRRFHEHHAQGKKCAKSLKGKTPLTLVFSQYVGDRSTALKLEYFIKTRSKVEKEKIVNLKKLPIRSST